MKQQIRYEPSNIFTLFQKHLVHFNRRFQQSTTIHISANELQLTVSPLTPTLYYY